MEQSGTRQESKMTHPKAPRIGFEAVASNPKLGLMDRVREVMRLRYCIPASQAVQTHARYHQDGRAETQGQKVQIEMDAWRNHSVQTRRVKIDFPRHGLENRSGIADAVSPG
jgi:hypothetical protein